MTSFQAKAFNFLLRNRHLMQGKLRKEAFDMNTSITGFRELCEKGASRYARLPSGITIREDSIAGIKAEWLIPADAPADKLILYVHGGGYVSGSCNDHRGFVSKFAASTGFTCLTYEYRLAPEHPFPAALEDSVNVYVEILKTYVPGNILIAGESAGGGLLLALLLAVRDRGIPLPSAAVAISPWTDLSCSGESYRTKNKRSVAPMNSWHVFSKHYTGDRDPRTPYISPLFGELSGLPPVFINAGTDDELFDDGRQFVEKAKAAGVSAEFRAGEGMVHCYPLMAPLFPEATQAMQEIRKFVASILVKDI
ncbi:MAG: alpha/beta hydrolase [Bacteroidales bacterium]|nr:alpha/beta hydrolase [Bacteroidales bacterium]